MSCCVIVAPFAVPPPFFGLLGRISSSAWITCFTSSESDPFIHSVLAIRSRLIFTHLCYIVSIAFSLLSHSFGSQRKFVTYIFHSKLDSPQLRYDRATLYCVLVSVLLVVHVRCVVSISSEKTNKTCALVYQILYRSLMRLRRPPRQIGTIFPNARPEPDFERDDVVPYIFCFIP